MLLLSPVTKLASLPCPSDQLWIFSLFLVTAYSRCKRGSSPWTWAKLENLKRKHLLLFPTCQAFGSWPAGKMVPWGTTNPSVSCVDVAGPTNFRMMLFSKIQVGWQKRTSPCGRNQHVLCHNVLGTPEELAHLLNLFIFFAELTLCLTCTTALYSTLLCLVLAVTLILAFSPNHHPQVYRTSTELQHSTGTIDAMFEKTHQLWWPWGDFCPLSYYPCGPAWFCFLRFLLPFVGASPLLQILISFSCWAPSSPTLNSPACQCVLLSTPFTRALFL